jgi:hypothetical protein
MTSRLVGRSGSAGAAALIFARLAVPPGGTGSRIGRERISKEAEMSTTALRTPEVDIDKIHVAKGFNSREVFDEAVLDRMAVTIKRVGVT